MYVADRTARNQTGTANHHRQHGGFTLIELLVVVSIIALLVGLLITGVQSARSAVQNAKASQELRNLDTAIAKFQSEFGQYPPSSITLHETQPGWNGDPRSRALIQKMWPQYNFANAIDFDGSGTATDGENVTLNGAECLVFFLAGVSIDGAPSGFSKNPTNPFDSTSKGNRVGPFHEFELNRFDDSVSGYGDGNGFPVYFDTFSGQTAPIVYLSSYDGRGYIPTEAQVFFQSKVNPTGVAGDVYRQTASSSLMATDGVAWKQNTYQLISPGRDAEFGVGRFYDPEDTANSQIEYEDHDNLTNFKAGRLR